MVEAYVVEGLLEWKSNTPEFVRQITAGFEKIDRIIGATKGSLASFTSELRELTAANRGIGALSRQLEKIKIPAGVLGDLRDMTGLTRELATAQNEMARDAMDASKAWREMALASRQVRIPTAGASGARGRGGSHVSGMDMAMGAQMVGDAGSGLLERSLGASFDVAHLMVQFRQNTAIGEKDLTDIRARADALAQAVPGTTIADNLHTILDAYTITGQISEAMKGAEGMARAKMIYESLPGAHQGDSSFAAGQAIEVMQRFYDPKTHQVDMDAFNKQLASMARVAVGTGGRVSGDAYLGFAKQARVGGMLANDDFLYGDLPALLIALGGNRSGTGDAATYRQFIQGRMTQNAFDQLSKTGMIDKGASWKHGQVTNMSQHLKGAAEFMVNPAAWVRDVLLPDLKQHGVNTEDRAALSNAIAQWASTNVGLGFLSELAIGMPGILKDKGKIATTSGDPMAAIEKYDPMQKMREFRAKETNFLTVLGDAAMGPALASMKALTATLQNLTSWAKANPTAAADLMLIGGGLSVLAKVAGDAAMFLFIGAPLIKGMGGLARALLPFGAGGSAAGALDELTAAGGAGSLFGLAAGITAIGAAMVALPPFMKWLFTPDGPPANTGDNRRHGNTNEPKSPDWWSGFWNGHSVAPGTNSRGGNVHHVNYMPGQGGMESPTVLETHVTIELDGRRVGKAVARQLVRGIGGAAQMGKTAFDGSMHQYPAGLPSGVAI